MDRRSLLLAAGLGLLAHVLIGYLPFPSGDDYAYAPLAERAADRTLFTRDDQLLLFDNHARVYRWVYELGSAGFGVEPTFRVAVWALAVLTAIALWRILGSLRAPVAALPAVLGLGVVVAVDGLGRGDYGGMISTFFHHHNIALTLLLGAVAAALAGRPWLAGAFLGLAVYAQPMTAFHGALVAGLGAFAIRPVDAVKMGLAAAVVSAPAAIPILLGLARTPGPSAEIALVSEAYRFRAPHHYDPDMRDILLATLYLFAGWAGALLISRRDAKAGRFAFGAITAFFFLHLVTVIVYKMRLSELTSFFILDANRSSPALFALAAAFAVAGLWKAKRDTAFFSTALLLAVILALNGTPGGIALVAMTGLIISLRKFAAVRGISTAALAGILMLTFPPAPIRQAVSAETHRVLDWIREETPPDALFVIPVGLFEFRQTTKRSAYVDFKLFSVAQPGQAALTRSRMEIVARPSPESRDVGGWEGAGLWEMDQLDAATCAGMAEILHESGADYYLRRVLETYPAPNCPDLESLIRSKTLALYGLRD